MPERTEAITQAREAMAKKLYLKSLNLSREGREAMAKWLNQIFWDWFLTITFRYDNISIFGITHLYYSLLNHIYEKERVYPEKAFFCLERHKYRMIPHLHTLIKFAPYDGEENYIVNEVAPGIRIYLKKYDIEGIRVENISRKFWWKFCFKRYGRTRIEPYDISLGAGYYLMKYVYKPDTIGWWDVIWTREDWEQIRKDYLKYKDEIQEKIERRNNMS